MLYQNKINICYNKLMYTSFQQILPITILKNITESITTISRLLLDKICMKIRTQIL